MDKIYLEAGMVDVLVNITDGQFRGQRGFIKLVTEDDYQKVYLKSWDALASIYIDWLEVA